jgi:hypothetical protein
VPIKEPSKLPGSVQLVDPKTGLPTPFFLRYFNDTVVAAIAGLADSANAQAAADAANAAAEAANEAAVSITTTTELANSYPEGAAISATDAGSDVTITITSHNRVYAGGTSVAVDGGTLTGLSYATDYWIAYDQASRAGGAVVYVAYTTTQGNGVNNPDRHFVGALTTPEAGGLDNDGVISLPPGGVLPRNLDGGELPP